MYVWSRPPVIGVEGVPRVGVLCVLGAGAGAKHRQVKPVDPAEEVSCAGR
jgi:hypothetical protein